MKNLIVAVALICGFTPVVFAGSLTATLGYFQPNGDSDIFEQNEFETTFETDDLNGFAAGFRYDHFVGEFINIGGGLSFYEDDTVVEDVEFEFPNGQPILRNIRLQIVPLELNIHVLPLGRNTPVIPYIGGGVGAYFWEYEEFGDFVIDRNDDPRVITGTAFSDGVDAGWHVEGGVQVPVSRSITVLAEGKYFDAEGDLDVEGFDPAFEPIDLSGFTISGGVSFWF